MSNEFISKDQDFAARIRTTYLRMTIAFPLGGVALAALYYHSLYYEGSRQRKFEKIWTGLSYMDPNSIVITLILSVTILTGLIVFIRSYYQKREIVIALTFDDQSKQLTIRTKTIHGQECVRKHHYSDLVLEYDRLSDGMTPQMYNTLTLAKGEYLAGHIYKNHFTWNEITVSEIETKLKKELKEITR